MPKLREHLHWYILGLLCVATILIWYAVAAEDRAGKLTVAFLDVGQGDAIFMFLIDFLHSFAILAA